MTATATQAERLAGIYGTITGGKKLPEAMEAEAIKDDTQPEAQAAELPKLHLMVSGEEKMLADLVATMTAAIWSGNTIYYFEIMATADVTAHAFGGAICDARGKDVSWEVRGQPFGPKWHSFEMAKSMTIRDSRVTTHGWGGYLHHMAALSKHDDLIVADTDEILWRKLRAKMTCPTMPEWGSKLLPRIKASGMLMDATTFGIGDAVKAYVFAPDAEELFDKIVRDHVLEHGLPDGQPDAQTN